MHCSTESASQFVKALYDYDSQVDGDLRFCKDQVIELLDSSNNDWWIGINKDGVQGYIPSNYVAMQDSIDSYE